MHALYISMLLISVMRGKCEVIQTKRYEGTNTIADSVNTTIARKCLFTCNATPGCIGFDVVSNECILDGVTATSGFAAQMSCMLGWYRFKESCYKVTDDKQNWINAEALCVADNSHLATIRSSKELMFIASLSNFLTGARHDLWIGGTDQVSEGNWQWTSGEPWDWDAFPISQPDNSGGYENCLHVTFSYEFNDIECDGDKYYVCES